MKKSDLEQHEKTYRTTDRTSGKYLKRLTDYITALTDSGRFLEAKHFFLELCQLSPNHPKTIRLGYSIAIATFDRDWVRKYDQLLITSTKDINELHWYRFCYYQSVNNIEACEDTGCELLRSILPVDRLSIVLEVCIARKSYTIAQSLAKYLSKNKIKLSTRYDKLLKKIIITRLTHSIQRRL